MHINEANDKIIKEVLKNFYIIPRFQRPYSWQQEEVEDFLNDILTNGKEYFIGSMVTFSFDGDKKGIVDGQQRLTTITLILVAIRELAKSINETDIAIGTNQYIERINDFNKTTSVINTETSYPTFQKIISNTENKDENIKPINNEEKNIYDVYNFIKSFIQQQLKNKVQKLSNLDKILNFKKEFLIELRDKVLNLTTIYIELDNEEDAYTIFETLNTRGRDLSTEDLIKNHIMQRLTTTNTNLDTPKDNWNKLSSYIIESKGSLSEFLYYQWESTNGICQQKDLFKNVRRTYPTKTLAKKYLEDLNTDKIFYRIIKTQNSAKENNVEDNELLQILKDISAFNVKQHIPALMLALREYKKRTISLKNLKILCKTIENFHFKYNAITSSRTSGSTTSYKNLITTLLNAADTNTKNKITKNFRFSETLIPEEEAFVEKLSKLYFVDDFTKNRKMLKYILRKLYETSIYASTPIDYNTMTIEHLISQCKINDDFSKDLVGQIGNLLLVTKEMQDKLKNKELKEKIKILNASNIKVPIDDVFQLFLENKIDEKEFIKKRTEAIAKKAYHEIWK